MARVFYGARISMIIGAVGAGVSLVIGVLWVQWPIFRRAMG